MHEEIKVVFSRFFKNIYTKQLTLESIKKHWEHVIILKNMASDFIVYK